MLKFQIFIFAVLLSACSSQPIYTNDTTENTFVLINFIDESVKMSCLSLFDVDRSEQHQICKPKKNGGIVMKPLPAGNYYMVKISSAVSAAEDLDLKQPKNLLVLEKGKINYLGDFIFQPRDGRYVFGIDINNKTIKDALAGNQEIFKLNKNVFIAENLIPPNPLFKRSESLYPDAKIRKSPYEANRKGK